jgi:hypothetical protein
MTNPYKANEGQQNQPGRTQQPGHSQQPGRQQQPMNPNKKQEKYGKNPNQ